MFMGLYDLAPIGFKVPLPDILSSRLDFKVPYYIVVAYLEMFVQTFGYLVWQVLRQLTAQGMR